MCETRRRHPSLMGGHTLGFGCSPISAAPNRKHHLIHLVPSYVPRTLRLSSRPNRFPGGKSITRRCISTGRLRGCRRLCRMLQSGLLPIPLARRCPSLRYPPFRSRPQHHSWKTVGPASGRPRKPRLLLALRPKAPPPSPPLRLWRPQVRPSRRARVTRRF